MSKIRIIYEDNHLLVVEKPVNVSSQEDSSGDADMLTLLKDDLKVRFDKPGNVYLGLVHRLDRPVGGVMVFAKTSKAASRLSDQVRKREFEKIYHAVIMGTPKSGKGSLRHYLYKDSNTNIVSVVSAQHEGAKEALLDYEILETRDGLSLVKVYLHTGRSHQIRVQFATIGHPLYGDQKYGERFSKAGQQIALWSTAITCKHPTRQELMTFKCEPPEKYPWNIFKHR